MNWLKIKRLDTSLPLPKYQTKGSSGMDLYAATDVSLAPDTTVVVPTGISIQLPLRYEGQIRSRSGLAAKYGVFVLNSPGTIDNDYRGEVKVILHNSSCNIVKFNKGDRIAQLIVCPYEQVVINEVINDDLTWTERGSGGLGSTGI